MNIYALLDEAMRQQIDFPAKKGSEIFKEINWIGHKVEVLPSFLMAGWQGIIESWDVKNNRFTVIFDGKAIPLRLYYFPYELKLLDSEE